MLLLDIPADFSFWKSVFPVLTNIATGGIVIFFLKKKIEAMTSQIDALKGQVESQQGILNTTKLYFEIFDINKLKEYATISEEKARMEARLSHQVEIDSLKEQDKVKKESLDAALKAASDSSERIHLLQNALDDKQEAIQNLQLQNIKYSSDEPLLRKAILNLKRDLYAARNALNESGSQANKAIDKRSMFAELGISYNSFEGIKQPTMPASILGIIKPIDVYYLLLTYPLQQLKFETTLLSAKDTLLERHPQLNTPTISLELYGYITYMALGIVGENIWNADVF